MPHSPTSRRSRSVLLAVLLAVAAALIFPASAAAPATIPTAHETAGLPTVGPLFGSGLQSPHGCTASVVHSSRHDLLLTAAHCIPARPATWQFVPGYDRGGAPFGVWTVTKAWLDPAWTASADPGHDFAFLSVAPRVVNGRKIDIEDVVGANLLQFAPAAGTPVTVPGYPIGTGDRPLTCANTVYWSRSYPSFNCHGYLTGTSGSPWLVRGRNGGRTAVVGVIGGLDQGGLQEYTSYSSPFGMGAYITLTRAGLNLPPDIDFGTGSGR